MPVNNPNTPQVQINLPVPTPVQQKPKPKRKAPVAASPQQQVTQPAQQALPQAMTAGSLQAPLGVTGDDQGAYPAFTPPPRMRALILPWTPQPKQTRAKVSPVSQQMNRRVVKFASHQWANRVSKHQGAMTWFGLDTFLGKKSRKVLGNNRVVHRDANGDIHIRLHSTDIVTAHHPNNGGGYTLRGNAWPSRTTAGSIQHIIGLPVSSAGGTLRIYAGGKKLEFSDGEKLDDIIAKALPPAPEQDWRPTETIPEDYYAQ